MLHIKETIIKYLLLETRGQIFPTTLLRESSQNPTGDRTACSFMHPLSVLGTFLHQKGPPSLFMVRKSNLSH